MLAQHLHPNRFHQQNELLVYDCSVNQLKQKVALVESGTSPSTNLFRLISCAETINFNESTIVDAL